MQREGEVEFLEVSSAGRLVDNIIYFCRALRKAGVPVAPSQTMDVMRAIEAVGFERREDFFETLRACLITRHEHFVIFDQVFQLFWRDPEFLQKMMQTMLPMLQTQSVKKQVKHAEKRAADAITNDAPPTEEFDVPLQDELVLDAELTASQSERLSSMDFDQMTNDEIRQAKRAIAGLKIDLPKLLSRRYRHNCNGNKIDIRATFNHARKNGGEIVKLIKRRPVEKPRKLVVLCDISGSMSSYSRMIMHFIYALSASSDPNTKSAWENIHAFTFGTRLTNVTRLLQQKDPDIALDRVGSTVQDWDGGTKIGHNLEVFNREWSRRVLGSDAVVMLVSDGLERGDTELLQAQIRRLKLSSGHVIWLNPLLRFDEFQPLASGIKAILPHVDKMVSCHNLKSLTELSAALSAKGKVLISKMEISH